MLESMEELARKVAIGSDFVIFLIEAKYVIKLSVSLSAFVSVHVKQYVYLENNGWLLTGC